MLLLSVSALAHDHLHDHDFRKGEPGKLGAPGVCPYEIDVCNPSSRATLSAPALRRLPLAGVAPHGWLGRQLVLQANGMSGWYVHVT
jgi:hypothetical protein